MRWIVARSASKRPTLMHMLVSFDRTACGLDIRGWSRAYLEVPIPQIVCLHCKKF